MIISELIAHLSSYPAETTVKVFDDWGSAYVLRSISNVLDSTEFRQEAEDGDEDPVVVICYNIEE